MRDPHVVALHYRLETGPQLALNGPAPVERETASFTLRLTNREARIEMKDHFSTEESARLEVEPYLRSWEIVTALERGPGAIRFAFDRADVIDRDPPPAGGPVELCVAVMDQAQALDSVIVRVSMPNYPNPPDGFVASPVVVNLWERYEGYLAGKEPLPSMVYYCATVVQQTEARSTISESVLSRLRYLSTMVGTAGTLRKRAAGQELRPHTPAETAWMEAVVKRIIQCVGDWAADPNAQWPQITMEDLPRL